MQLQAMPTTLPRDLVDLHARRVLTPWVPQAKRQPPTIVRGAGCRLYDDRDRAYLDFSAGLVAVNLGHGHPAVADAIGEQAKRLAYAPPSLGNDRRAELADAIIALAPWGQEGGRVFFTTGGGEGNEDAIKFARALTGRHKVLSAYRSFHGSAPGAGMLTGENRRWPNEPGMPGVARFFTPFPYRSPFFTRDPAEECARALAHLDDVLTYEGGERIAALLIEPIVGSNGVIVYPQGYLAGVRERCTRHGILLIFDEVMTGFGRTGEAFAAQRFDVTPDIFTFAKAVTSAYVPLGGVAVRESLAAHFDTHPVPSGHTFSGHPLAMAAGLATLQAYRDEALFARARDVETWLAARFERLQAAHPMLGEVRGTGAFFGLELVKDRATREPLVAWQGSANLQPLVADLLQRGLYLYARYNVLIIAPPLIVSQAEIDEGGDILDAAFTHFEREHLSA